VPAMMPREGGRRPLIGGRYRQRNQVERPMNRRRQFRAVATRHYKLAERYEATITVEDIFIDLGIALHVAVDEILGKRLDPGVGQPSRRTPSRSAWRSPD
jgi:hypothetical protein